MFGDPLRNNLCSSCYKDSKMRHPFQRPGDVYSAPLKPSPRVNQRPISYSQEIPRPQNRQHQVPNRVVQVPSHNRGSYGNQVIITGSSSPATVQAGQVPYYIPCATQDCQNQANPNILEGYCNHCYKAYNDVFTETKDLVRGEPVGQPAAAHQQRPQVGEPQERPPRVGYGFEQDMALPSQKPTKIRCKHDWCNNYGNPHRLGYCNECYELTQMCK